MEGRFKPCLVDSEQYLPRCYRYIELNPVRTWMVEAPYPWSSYAANAGGHADRLVTPHAAHTDSRISDRAAFKRSTSITRRAGSNRLN